jgi:hypothetical protein
MLGFILGLSVRSRLALADLNLFDVAKEASSCKFHLFGWEQPQFTSGSLERFVSHQSGKHILEDAEKWQNG